MCLNTRFNHLSIIPVIKSLMFVCFFFPPKRMDNSRADLIELAFFNWTYSQPSSRTILPFLDIDLNTEICISEDISTHKMLLVEIKMNTTYFYSLQRLNNEAAETSLPW